MNINLINNKGDIDENKTNYKSNAADNYRS